MIILDFLEIVLTTKCNLRCKNCSHLTPYYKETYIYDINAFEKDMISLFSCVSHIKQIYLIGGEPLLYYDINSVMHILNTYYDKIDKITITSNGTVLPSIDTLKLLYTYKIGLSLSNKTIYSFMLLSSSYTIGYKCNLMIYKKWINYGKIDILENTSSENKITKKCNGQWLQMYNGNIYFCPRAMYVTLHRKKKIGCISINKLSLDFINNITPNICNICNLSKDNRIYVTPYEQL